MPAVVLVHGSGFGDRDATVGQIKLFKDLALGLASRGIAVLRYDKRSRVHATLMRDMTGLTVSRNGSTTRSRRSTCSGTAGLAQADGAISAEEQAQITEIEQLMARIAAQKPGDASNTERIFGAPESYWRDLRSYDPPAAAAQMEEPMLVLQGERDYQVTMEEFSRWTSALGDRLDVSFHSYATLNQPFVAGNGNSLPAAYNTPGHISEEAVRDAARWSITLAPGRQ